MRFAVHGAQAGTPGSPHHSLLLVLTPPQSSHASVPLISTPVLCLATQ